ncbi:MAG: hypothetical protein KIH08_14560 [Candidatus Freyarchaeota archaeon]|nr:hypothetical protein [Candidatus Jordarchaeia archaeon]MBS7268220.1 hypothetical protein [Candidatus Jordarchaeia archaeon]MBS7279328.1 hypothetical protein [Candidatus Jordarchaeia archaeon]
MRTGKMGKVKKMGVVTCHICGRVVRNIKKHLRKSHGIKVGSSREARKIALGISERSAKPHPEKVKLKRKPPATPQKKAKPRFEDIFKLGLSQEEIDQMSLEELIQQFSRAKGLDYKSYGEELALHVSNELLPVVLAITNRFGSAAIKPLMDYIRLREEPVWGFALATIIKIDGEEAIPYLIELLDEELYEETIDMVISSLAKYGEPVWELVENMFLEQKLKPSQMAPAFTLLFSINKDKITEFLLSYIDKTVKTPKDLETDFWYWLIEFIIDENPKNTKKVFKKLLKVSEGDDKVHEMIKEEMDVYHAVLKGEIITDRTILKAILGDQEAFYTVVNHMGKWLGHQKRRG